MRSQGSGGFLSFGQLWNGFIAALVLFFVLTIIDQARASLRAAAIAPAARYACALDSSQLAKAKQAELDEIELNALDEELRDKKRN